MDLGQSVSANQRSAELNRSPVLSVQRLSVSYEQKMAIRDVELDIQGGTITALVGPSGCGKSTLLMSMNRLVEEVPGVRIDGDLTYQGTSIYRKDMDLRWLRMQIGLIFQKPTPFPLSIRQNVLLPLKEHGLIRRGDEDQVLQASLERVGLWGEVKDHLNRSALKLSGGQQQRLCIARALVLQPKVLLMDEPCSALDPIAGGIIEDLIAELRQSFAIVVITHNLAQARRISDRTGVMWYDGASGQLVEVGATDQVFSDPKSEVARSYMQGIRG